MSDTKRLGAWGWFVRAFAAGFGAICGLTAGGLLACILYGVVAGGIMLFSSMGSNNVPSVQLSPPTAQTAPPSPSYAQPTYDPYGPPAPSYPATSPYAARPQYEVSARPPTTTATAPSAYDAAPVPGISGYQDCAPANEAVEDSQLSAADPAVASGDGAEPERGTPFRFPDAVPAATSDEEAKERDDSEAAE